MASFKVTGIDELAAAFQKAENIPSNVTERMLSAMADIVVSAQQASAKALGVVATGLTISSIRKKKPKITAYGGSIDVEFAGSRKRYNTTTRNAEIAFINEFGKKGQPARPFISQANKTSGEKMSAAGEKVFTDWLEKTGL